MENENQMETSPQERESREATPKKKNVLIIVIAAVLCVVLLGVLGLAVIVGTDGIAGFDGIKLKISQLRGEKPAEEVGPSAPEATQPEESLPSATAPAATEPLNLKSYTVDEEKAAQIVDQAVATAGSDTLTNGILQAYYQTTLLTYYSNNYYALMYSGVDLSQPLDQMVYDPNTNQTWQEFMLESALQTWHLFTAVQQFGATSEEYGYTFTQVGQEYVENLPGRIQEMAEASGFTDPEEFVKKQIGITATVEGLRNYMEKEYYYVCYYSYLQEKLMPTMEQIEQYYTDHEALFAQNGITKESGDVVDVRHILITPKGGTTEGTTTTYSEEQWEAARVEAQELLDTWKSGEATEKTFAELANEHTEDTGSQSTGGLYTAVEQGDMVTEFDTWIFAEGRAFGDTDLVKTPYGYHIMFFVKREPKWVSTARANCLNDALIALLDEVTAQYPLDVNYDAIGLSN